MKAKKPKAKKTIPLFSGEYSVAMWNLINGAKTKAELQDALYIICCRLQELETRLEKGEYK